MLRSLFLVCVVGQLSGVFGFPWNLPPNFMYRPEWDSLRVKWGLNIFSENNFRSLPRRVSDAHDARFALLRDECQEIRQARSEERESRAKFAGRRYWKYNDPSVVLIYDVNGYVAGMQTAIPKKLLEKDGKIVNSIGVWKDDKKVMVHSESQEKGVEETHHRIRRQVQTRNTSPVPSTAIHGSSTTTSGLRTRQLSSSSATPGLNAATPGPSSPTLGSSTATPGLSTSTPGSSKATLRLSTTTLRSSSATPGSSKATPGLDTSTPGLATPIQAMATGTSTQFLRTSTAFQGSHTLETGVPKNTSGGSTTSFQGTPTLFTGTPTHSTGTPTLFTGTPTHSPGTPTPFTGTLFPGPSTPIPVSSTPTLFTGTPTHSPGTPTPFTGTLFPGTSTPIPVSSTPTLFTGTPTHSPRTPTPFTGTLFPGTSTPIPVSSTPFQETRTHVPVTHINTPVTSFTHTQGGSSTKNPEFSKEQMEVLMKRPLLYPYVEDDEFLFFTVYFIEPEYICNPERAQTVDRFEHFGTGSGLYIQNGTGIQSVIEVPRDERKLQENRPWKAEKCFWTQGKIYSYNFHEDQDCKTQFPLLLNYNKGRLTGFAMLWKMDFSSRYLEHPDKGFLKFMFEKVPKCYYGIGRLTKLQIYFTNDYLSHRC